MHDPQWVTYRDELCTSYRNFVQFEYGQACYQSTQHYLDWLYCANPFSRGMDDFLVGVVDGIDVVGCIHKMRLPWTINGKLCDIPTLHNLVVRSDYRTGAGFWLLKKALHGEEHAIIPGVTEPFSAVYRHMKCQAVPSRWFRFVLRYVRGGIALGIHKLTRGGFTPHHYLVHRDLYSLGCRLTTHPNEDDLACLAATLNVSSGRDHVMWDSTLVQWRFFHDTGPRHALIVLSDDPSAQAIVSLGPRSGLTVARLIFLSDAWIALGASGLKRLCNLLRQTAAHVVLTMTTRNDCAMLLAKAQFEQYKINPDTYFFHKDRQFVQESVLGSEVTDIGFESVVCSGGGDG
jgi:hypothetical protein